MKKEIIKMLDTLDKKQLTIIYHFLKALLKK